MDKGYRWVGKQSVSMRSQGITAGFTTWAGESRKGCCRPVHTEITDT
jgi:hypothetical protein